MSSKCLQALSCTEIEGKSLLVQDMRIACYESTWTAYAIVSGLYILVFTIGFPVGVCWFLYTQRHRLSDSSVLEDAGFLYAQYSEQMYAWEALELVRRLFLTSVVGVIATGPFALPLATAVSMAYHLVHARLHPYTHGHFNMLQHVCMGACTTIFLVGLTLNSLDASVNPGWMFSLLAGVLVLASSVVLAALVVVGAKETQLLLVLARLQGRPVRVVPVIAQQYMTTLSSAAQKYRAKASPHQGLDS